MTAVVVVGGQWGDEGKGKIIDACAKRVRHVVRAQGGNNAGHTIIIGDTEYKLHLTPSGILQSHTLCYIGAGTVIDLHVLAAEWEMLQKKGIQLHNRIWIAPEAHIIMPFHKLQDRLAEERKGALAIGTTGRGIGPSYSDKINRIGIRIGDLIDRPRLHQLIEQSLVVKNQELEGVYGLPPLDFQQIIAEIEMYREKIIPYIGPVDELLYKAWKAGEDILLEGAQGTFLDVSFGTYPYATSSNTVAAGICAGAGLGPTAINSVLGIFKCYLTRVGNGPFPTEQKDDGCFLDHKAAREFGTTTGRKRRCGWFDAVLARKAVQVNGCTSFALTKLDILDPLETIQVCTAYRMRGEQTILPPTVIEDWEHIEPVYQMLPGWQCATQHIKDLDALPKELLDYVKFLENLLGIPCTLLSVGPEREQTLQLDELFSTTEAMQ